MKKVISNVFVTVGAIVGIGFLSGQELVLFVGNDTNLIVFALMFEAIHFTFCWWTSKQNTSNFELLCRQTFGKRCLLPYGTLLCCNLLSAVAILSATQATFEKLTTTTPLPLFSLAVVAICIVLQKVSSQKLNLFFSVTTLFSALLLATQLFENGEPTRQTTQVSPLVTVCYATYSATMLVGLDCKTCQGLTIRQCIAATCLSTIAIVILAKIGLSHSTTYNQNNAFAFFQLSTFFCSATTSLYANTLAPLSLAKDLLQDEFSANTLLFGVCLAVSVVGVECAMRYGYVVIAIVGFALTVSVLTVNIAKNAKNKSTMPTIVLSKT